MDNSACADEYMRVARPDKTLGQSVRKCKT